MRLCELERVQKERGSIQLKYTGEKMKCYLTYITPEMVGAILELSKVAGKWALLSVDDNDLEHHNVRSCLYTPKPKEVN